MATTSETPKAPEAPKLPEAPKASRSTPTAAEAAKGYVRPHRDAVVHVIAGKRCPVTILPADHADFHARQPGVIDKVRCSACRRDFPASEFVWHGTDERIGT
jgi:hypothetical protein